LFSLLHDYTSVVWGLLVRLTPHWSCQMKQILPCDWPPDGGARDNPLCPQENAIFLPRIYTLFPSLLGPDGWISFFLRVYGPWLRLNDKQAKTKSKNRDTRKEKPTTNNHKKKTPWSYVFFKTPIYIISSFYFILKQDHFRYLVFFKISTLGLSSIIPRWELRCSPLLMRRFILFL